MRMIFKSFCLLWLCACTQTHYMTSTGYLGIPNQDQVPGKVDPIPEIRNRYYAISKVEEVPFEIYLWHKERDRAIFEVFCGNIIYFSSEVDTDYEVEPGCRDYVRILERKKTIRP